MAYDSVRSATAGPGLFLNAASRRGEWLLLAVALVGLLGWPAVLAAGQGSGDQQATPSRQAPPQTALSTDVHERIEAALDQLEEDGDYDKAYEALLELFDQVVAHVHHRHQQQFRRTAVAVRLVAQLRELPASQSETLLPYLRANPQLTSTLVLAVMPERQSVRGVYGLLDKLREEHGERLNTYANLATAICIVHDRDLVMRVNENTAEAPDPVELFEYFLRHENRMVLGVRNVPPQLLVFVVDTTASIDDLTWALRRFGGDPNLGRRYFQISYDYDHLRRGTPKRVTEEGFNLPNILEYGGVCADQAYFAMQVGKAMGIPTAYASGRGANVGHAWLGYFDGRGRQPGWNFNAGRYEEFQDIRGLVRHPQTRERIPDAFVSLQAEMLGTSRTARQTSIALTDAAARIVQWMRDEKEPPDRPHVRIHDLMGQPRQAEVASALSLLEAAANQNPANERAWLLVRNLAKDGAMSMAQIQRWAGVLEQFCGQKYPDFAAEIIVPMVRSVPDLARQDALWNRVYNFFRRRPDIAAEIRFEQAQMWEEAGELRRAGRAYEDILRNFANSGPHVIDALERSEKALREMERPRRIPQLYGQTWQRIRRPDPTAYSNVSNWYRVGERYAEILEEFGERQKARDVRADLEELWQGEARR